MYRRIGTIGIKVLLLLGTFLPSAMKWPISMQILRILAVLLPVYKKAHSNSKHNLADSTYTYS